MLIDFKSSLSITITFLITFPLKAPTYYISRKFKKYDWAPRADPKKPKSEDEHDIIVIGSVIGGLACVALLAKRG